MQGMSWLSQTTAQIFIVDVALVEKEGEWSNFLCLPEFCPNNLTGSKRY